MKHNKYLPELVIGWIIAVAIIVSLASCSSTRVITIKTPTIRISGSSPFHSVNLHH